MVRAASTAIVALLFALTAVSAEGQRIRALEKARAEGNAMEERLRAEDPQYDIKKALVLDTIDLRSLPVEQRTTAFEQQYKKTQITVLVTHSGEDRVGQRLASWLKEAIDRSAFMHTAYSGAPFTARIASIKLVDGVSTAYSMTITRDTPALSLYVTSMVGSCGADRLENCATGLAGDIRETIESYAGVHN